MKKSKCILNAILLLIFMDTNILIANETTETFDKEYMVKSVEAELYIRVRANDLNKPVLLYLHGGPGEANGPLLFQAYAGPELEKHFIVGYLHQRHTCLSPEAPLNTLTIEQFIDDIDSVVTFLKEEFEKEKILLLGHSFGGALGYLYVLDNEDNIKKFVCAGGAFSMASIEENGYQTVMELARETNNQAAIETLENTGPPPYGTLQEGMTWRMLGMSLLESMDDGIMKNLDMSKVMLITGIDEFDPQWQKKSMEIAYSMWQELGEINIENDVEHIGIPMLLIVGAKDIMVPFSILEQGYENYGGEKQYFILENSNHMMFIDDPDLFVSKVIEFLLK